MQRRAVIGLAAATLVLLTLPIVGTQQPAREARGQEPWRVSWEERMTRRFSAGEQERRLAAYLGARERTAEVPSEWYVIEGARDPEAFVPSELFSQLVAGAFAPFPESRAFWRSLYESRIVDPQVREDFWQRLEIAIAPLLEVKRRKDRLIAELNRTPREEHAALRTGLPDSVASCGIRAEALASARREFTAGGFDRVLYEAVAPNMTVSARSTQADLEYIEGGCR